MATLVSTYHPLCFSKLNDRRARLSNHSSVGTFRLSTTAAVAVARCNRASLGAASSVGWFRGFKMALPADGPASRRPGRGSGPQAKKDFVDVENSTTEQPLLSKKEGTQDTSYTWTAVLLPFLFPALGGLLFGYDIGSTSGAVVSLTDSTTSGTSWYALSSIETGLVTSGSLYGALPGSLLAYNIADRIGRRKELITAAGIYIVGSLLSALAPNLGILITGRFVYGLSIGLAMHAAPMYISETVPSDIRGTMVALKEVLIVVGILLGYLVGSLAIETVGGWRIMYAVASGLAAIMGIGAYWLPPSPRWVLLRAVQGKVDLGKAKEDAKAAFSKLRGKSLTDPVVEAQTEEALESVQAACGGQQEVSIAQLFEGKKNKRAFTIGGGLVLFQQITGQPSVLYYATQILQSAGFSAAADATKVSVVLGFFKLISTSVATLYVDKLGRRPLLIGGIGGIVFSLVALAAYYSFASGIPALAVIALLLYVGCYQLSFGPISWLMVSEVFPLQTRGRALSITTLINFAANALVAFAFSPIQDLIGAAATFLLFGVIAVIALLFAIFLVPETKGLTLEEVEAKLSE